MFPAKIARGREELTASDDRHLIEWIGLRMSSADDHP